MNYAREFPAPAACQRAEDILEEVEASAFVGHVEDVSWSVHADGSLHDDHDGHSDHREALYNVRQDRGFQATLKKRKSRYQTLDIRRAMRPFVRSLIPSCVIINPILNDSLFLIATAARAFSRGIERIFANTYFIVAANDYI